MSFDTELVTMTRHYIDDLDEDNQKYGNERLKELLVFSAMKVKMEASLSRTYTLNLETVDICPDPTESPYRDEPFMILITFRAAAFITASEMKTASGQALSIRDGSSAVDLRGIAAQKKAVADFYEKAYEDALFKYQIAERPSGQAIMGPVSIITAGYVSGYYNNYTFRSRPIFN